MSLQDIDPVMCFRKCLSSGLRQKDASSLLSDLLHMFLYNSSSDAERTDSRCCCCICESVLVVMYSE